MNTFIQYPADEKYNSAALENNVQVITAVRSLVSLKATNTSGGVVWLGIWDDKPTAGSNPAATGKTSKKLLDIVPIAAPGWYQYSVMGGSDLRYGCWVGAYSTAALAIAGGAPDAGAVMFYKVDFKASVVLPQV